MYLCQAQQSVCKYNLLCIFTYIYDAYIDDVTITTPPENRTVNRGDDVTISCGYMTVMALPVTWIINGRSFTQQEIMNSPLYRLNFATIPMFTSLTVFSINVTTIFQCVVQSTPNTTSTHGTVIVIGMYVHLITYIYLHKHHTYVLSMYLNRNL